jgi:hypothetical protein
MDVHILFLGDRVIIWPPRRVHKLGNAVVTMYMCNSKQVLFGCLVELLKLDQALLALHTAATESRNRGLHYIHIM